MVLLGELLLAAGALDQDALEQGLRAQVMWGGRLGTNLVELGLLSLDTLSTALGRQHKMPAALATHFERADRELVLQPDIAERFSCMPLVRAGKRIVITSISPLDERATAIVARDLGVEPHMVVPSIAAELRFRFYLEKYYGIVREQRFRRAHGTELQASTFQPLPGEIPVERTPMFAVQVPEAMVLDEPPGPAPSARVATTERRTYVQTLADHANADSAEFSLVRKGPPHPELSAGALADALAAIETARDRDDVAKLVIGSVAAFVPEYRAALLLVVRGEAATSWTSICRDGRSLPTLAVPLDQDGLITSARRRNTVTRSSSGNLGPIDYMLLGALGSPFGDLVCAPIAIGGHVRSMIAVALEPNVPAPGLVDLAAAAGASFARLMRSAARR